MATFRRCDFCNKSDEAGTKHQAIKLLYSPAPNGKAVAAETLDLCYQCALELARYLDGKSGVNVPLRPAL